jgi:2-(1,2-epoxy-1,2-dihydrophenyl)acetyl-CoA isomerase
VGAGDRVRLSVEDGIARLTLARADARNAIDPAMVEALADAVPRCAAARAVLLSHDGPTFSVGGDLRYLGARSDRLREELEPMVALYHQALAAIAELPIPVVCAVRGAVAGGALGLLWCADVTIVAQDAKLVTGFMQLGLSGDGGSSWWLPRLVGLQRARQLLLHRGPITGAMAAEWGLVTAAFPEGEVDPQAQRAIDVLAAHPAAAYAEMRALIANAFDRDLVTGLEAERQAMLRTAATPDARERVARFTMPPR